MITSAIENSGKPISSPPDLQPRMLDEPAGGAISRPVRQVTRHKVKREPVGNNNNYF